MSDGLPTKHTQDPKRRAHESSGREDSDVLEAPWPISHGIPGLLGGHHLAHGAGPLLLEHLAKTDDLYRRLRERLLLSSRRGAL